MATFADRDATASPAPRMQAHEGPIVPVDVITFDPKGKDALLKARIHDAGVTKAQPGDITAQPHECLAGGPTNVTYAVWQNVERCSAPSAMQSSKAASAAIRLVPSSGRLRSGERLSPITVLPGDGRELVQ